MSAVQETVLWREVMADWQRNPPTEVRAIQAILPSHSYFELGGVADTVEAVFQAIKPTYERFMDAVAKAAPLIVNKAIVDAATGGLLHPPAEVRVTIDAFYAHMMARFEDRVGAERFPLSGVAAIERIKPLAKAAFTAKLAPMSEIFAALTPQLAR